MEFLLVPRLGLLVRRLGSSARRLGSSRRLCARVVDGIDGIDGIDGSSRRRFGSAQLVGLAQLIFYFRRWGSSRRLCARVVDGSTRRLSSSSACRLARRVARLCARVVDGIDGLSCRFGLAQLVCSARLVVFCFRRLGSSCRLSALARRLFGSARLGSSARRHIG